MPAFLSIVIPCWNEERRLPATFAALEAFWKEAAFSCEVVLVVEPGKDATLEVARAFAAAHPQVVRVVSCLRHLGKGHAVRNGMVRAQGELIFYMDADLSVPLREILAFVEAFAASPQVGVLVGNRAHAQSRITRRQSLLRRAMGQSFNLLLRACGMATLHDTQCGFKGFRRAASRAIFIRQRLDGFAFDVEVLLWAEHLGIQIGELPVEWINSPESKVRILRDSFGMLREMLWVKRRFAEERWRAEVRKHRRW